MKFDEAVNYIAENLNPVANEMARPVNPEFQKWKQENPGVPVYKFFKMQRAKKAGIEPVPVVDTPAPVTKVDVSAEPKYKDSPATKRTKEAVADFLQHNPGASVEEVISGIEGQNTDETPLNLDPEAVQSAINDFQAEPAGSEEVEPSIDSIRKSELASKYDKMRQALYKARGLKAKPGRRSSAKDEEPADEFDLDGGTNRRINMRDEPFDPNEL